MKSFVCLTAAALLVAPAVAPAAVDLFQSPASGNNDIMHGHAVRDAGDVNGDGYPDFVAGAPFDNTNGAEAGRAFIWFGGPTMSDGPNVVLDEGSAFDWFGFSVAGIGDIDDDGFDDVAVGAPGDDPTGEKSGAVYVYYGRSVNRRTVNLNWSDDRVFAGEVGGDRFGWSVSAAGDLNRDGVDDFVVGAPYSDATGTDRGRAYLFLGSAGTIAGTPAVTWNGPALGGPQSGTDFAAFAPDGQAIGGPGFGWCVADVPNFRGLNRAAVAIGAPGAAGSIGEVHLFFAPDLANTLPSSSAGTVLKNGTAAQQFGWSVSSGGMIDGDTRTDVIVGAPGADGGRGLVKVFYGVATPPAEDSVANFVRTGEVAGDRFGFAVADAGDHLGSAGTWIVGAPSRDDDGLNAGWVYVYDSTAQLPTDRRPINRTGTGVAGDRWGFALSALGDLDGDGSDDFLIGAPGANVQNGSVRGLVALVSSEAGVVANGVPTWHVRSLDAGRVRVDVFGQGPRDADSVQIVDGERTLATRGDGIETTFDGVRATFERPRGVDHVDLVWTVDATRFSQSIGLPARSEALLLRADAADGGVTLRFSAGTEGPWSLRLVDVRGRVVATPARGSVAAFDRVVHFDGSDDASRPLGRGVYFAVLEQGGRQVGARVVLTR